MTSKAIEEMEEQLQTPGQILLALKAEMVSR